jgi:hypothetical protein
MPVRPVPVELIRPNPFLDFLAPELVAQRDLDGVRESSRFRSLP